MFSLTRLNCILLALFCVLLCPLADCRAQSPLTTNLTGGVGYDGCMFDVKSLTGVSINDFDIAFTGTSTVEIWALNFPGSFLGNITSNGNWTQIASIPGVVGMGFGVPIPLGINLGFPVPAGTTQAFYIHVDNGVMWTNVGTAVGTVHAASAEIEFHEGHGGAYFDQINFPVVFNGNIYYTPLSSAVNDVSLSQPLAPLNDTINCLPLTSVESVSMEIKNTGVNPIPTATSLQVEYRIDERPPVIEFITLSSTLFPGAVLTHNFVTTVDLSVVDLYQMRMGVSLAGDSNTSNNFVTYALGSGGQLRVNQFPYYEDFTVVGSNGDNIPPYGFINEVGDSFGVNADWVMRNNATPTFGAGPTADHSFGIPGVGGYAHVEDNGNLGPINLRSPCFDFTQMTNPQLTFYLHSDTMNPLGSQNRMYIDLLFQPSGAYVPGFYGPQDQLGTGWTKQVVDLSFLSGQIVQLIFRTETMSSSNSSHDVAIDDISIAEIKPTPGQEPRNGISVLNINDCININGEPLQFQQGGPYFTAVECGDQLRLRMSGEPSLPIIMLSGPLNPTSATFGGIGNFDIGGPRDLTTGLPTALNVIGDGTASGLFNAIFFTDPFGDSQFGSIVPNIPPGILTTFQCVHFTTTGTGLSLSNAVQLTIL